MAFSTWPEMTLTIQGQDSALPEGALLVSGNYFSGLGVKPLFGRLISPEENLVPGGSPVAVLSYGFGRADWDRIPQSWGHAPPQRTGLYFAR